MTAYQKLDSFIEKHYAENGNSGVLRITHRDEILYEKNIGYADIGSGTPFSKDSMFTLYSMSKPLCTFGLMKLYDKGLVDIEAHPSKYLPEADGFDKRVTLHQIMNHIGGIPDFDQTPEFKQTHRPGPTHMMREQLRELAAYPQVNEPGTVGVYANVNFVIPALIIENVSGMNYADYMKKEVFAPLGMENAIVDNENLVIENRVTGYEKNEEGVILPTERTLNWMFGAGDVAAALDDVYRINHAIKHRLLLSKKAWELVLTPSPINKMGLGCTVTNWHGKHRITHNGGSRGFRTLHIQLPEDDFDIILLSNSGWGDMRKDYAEEIYKAFYENSSDAGDDVSMDKGYI